MIEKFTFVTDMYVKIADMLWKHRVW